MFSLEKASADNALSYHNRTSFVSLINMDSSAKTPSEPVDDDRTGLSVPALRKACADNLFYVQGKFPAIATKNDLYMALAHTVRDRLRLQGQHGQYPAPVEGRSA